MCIVIKCDSRENENNSNHQLQMLLHMECTRSKRKRQWHENFISSSFGIALKSKNKYIYWRGERWKWLIAQKQIVQKPPCVCECIIRILSGSGYSALGASICICICKINVCDAMMHGWEKSKSQAELNELDIYYIYY